MKVEYFFSPISAFAYIGHKKIINLKKKFNFNLILKPIDLSYILENSGGVPLNLRHSIRKKYRIIELKRFSKLNKVKINTSPRHFPPKNVNLVSRIILSCIFLKIKKDILFFFLENLWKNNKDICDLKLFKNYCKINNLDFDKIIRISNKKFIKDTLRKNNFDALKKGVFGSPTYFFKGKIYWGQDRIFLLKKNFK